MATQTVYKVVHCRGEKLHSAFVSNTPIGITYKAGEWITPEVGKVFAFSNYEAACYFRRVIADKPANVWEAEATEVEEASFPIFLTHITTISKYYRSFWMRRFATVRRLVNLAGYLAGAVPAGTVVCSSIKLIRKVE